jgi:hypothetical protein
MPTPVERPDADADDAAEADALAELEAIAELEANAADGDAGLERLKAAGDVDGIMRLARAYRVGGGAIERDLGKCLACYRAAASLGSVDAKYSVALFLLAGGVVPQDVKAGAAELRAAADGGSLPAKVYLANLYEQGIAYKADADKADVWYRSAARAAGLKAEPGTPEFTRAMADLGSVRHGVDVLNDAATSAHDKGLLGRKLKAYGWQLRVKDDPAPASAAAAPSTPPPADAASDAPVQREAQTKPARRLAASSPSLEADMAPAPGSDAAPAAEDKAQAKTKAPAVDGEARAKPAAKAAPARAGAAPKKSALTLRLGLNAFLVAALFSAMGCGAGYLLGHGAVELAKQGPVPLFGPHVELVLPAVVALFSLLPGVVVYRLGTVARALVVAALAAIAGYVAHGAPGGALLPSLEMQVTAFALAGWLGSALILGLLGGSRLKAPRPPPAMPIGRPIRDDDD